MCSHFAESPRSYTQNYLQNFYNLGTRSTTPVLLFIPYNSGYSKDKNLPLNADIEAQMKLQETNPFSFVLNQGLKIPNLAVKAVFPNLDTGKIARGLKEGSQSAGRSVSSRWCFRCVWVLNSVN